MKTKSTTLSLNSGINRVAIGTLGLLMIPLLGRWNWTVSDYILMGALMLGFGSTYVVISKKVAKDNKLVIGIMLTVLFMLIWAELAVGLFGTPFAGD